MICQAGAGGLRSVVAATAEEFLFLQTLQECRQLPRLRNREFAGEVSANVGSRSSMHRFHLVKRVNMLSQPFLAGPPICEQNDFIW